MPNDAGQQMHTLLLTMLVQLSCGGDVHLGLLNVEKNEWMWKDGSNMGNQVSGLDGSGPVYPGSRAGSATWQDRNGDLWMFGGKGYDHFQTEAGHELNDLWMYNSTAQKWSLLHAGGNASQPHTGQRQVPSPRWGAAACGVEGIILVIFGGKNANDDKLFDTWIYEIKNKKWLPLYQRASGGKGEKPEHPGGRVDATVWCHRDKLVVFGGLGNRRTPLDDMWIFSLRTLRWSKVVQIIDTKELMDSPEPVLFPEPRTGASSWVVAGKNWFMFGGNRTPIQLGDFVSVGSMELLDDMWSFELSAGNVSKRFTATWTHVFNGADKKVTPTARQLSAAWTDYQGYLWVFAGLNASGSSSQFLSDTWKFHPKRKSWSLESSMSANRTRVTNKSKGRLLIDIIPSVRCRAVSWTHKNITYIFGGYGLDARRKPSYLNDMWIFVQPFTHVPVKLFPGEFGDSREWLHNLPPSTVFWICLGTFGGIALVFGTGFFLKKMLIDYPRHNPNSGFNVRYSPLKDEANFEMW